MEEPKLEIHSDISTMSSLLPICQVVLKLSGYRLNFVLVLHYIYLQCTIRELLCAKVTWCELCMCYYAWGQMPFPEIYPCKHLDGLH